MAKRTRAQVEKDLAAAQANVNRLEQELKGLDAAPPSAPPPPPRSHGGSGAGGTPSSLKAPKTE